MRCSRVVLAKVAFSVGTEDEAFWVNRQARSDPKTAETLRELVALGEVPATPVCLSYKALIYSGDSGKFSHDEREHLYECYRCAHIGQFIANMSDPSESRAAPLRNLAG